MTPNLLRQDLMLALRDIYQLDAFSALEDMLQGESLTLQYLALHAGEDIYPSDLSRELRLSRSRITSTLNSLRGKELVEMHHSQQDRRRVKVAITQAGLLLIGQKTALMEAYFDQMIQGLGDEDAKRLISLIHRCVEVMQK